MGERFCPFCGRANKSDLPRCMNCGQRMMPTVPQTERAKEAAQGRSVLLQHDEDNETQTIAARTGNHEPWWRTPDGSPFGTIPPPPQVKEEMERFQAREAAKESVRRAEDAAKEATLAHERKKADAAAARAVARAEAAKTASTAPVAQTAKTGTKTGALTAAQLECLRCGTVPPPGGGFSFCLSCGGDLTGTVSKTVFTAPSATRTTAASASHSVAAPGAAGLRQLHEADAKTSTSANVSISLLQTSPTKAGVFSPGFAALFSFFVPGVGQIMNGQIAKGVVLLLASFFVTTVLSIPTVGLLPLIGRVVAALDAYRIADRRRKGQAVRPDEWDLG